MWQVFLYGTVTGAVLYWLAYCLAVNCGLMGG
jgi:hypothetical protein